MNQVVFRVLMRDLDLKRTDNGYRLQKFCVENGFKYRQKISGDYYCKVCVLLKPEFVPCKYLSMEKMVDDNDLTWYKCNAPRI